MSNLHHCSLESHRAWSFAPELRCWKASILDVAGITYSPMPRSTGRSMSQGYLSRHSLLSLRRSRVAICHEIENTLGEHWDSPGAGHNIHLATVGGVSQSQQPRKCRMLFPPPLTALSTVLTDFRYFGQQEPSRSNRQGRSMLRSTDRALLASADANLPDVCSL
jgi:hypothetical protein